MIIEIKHRISGTVLFSVKAESLKLAIEIAVSRDANLRGAYLRDAYLGDAENYSENHDFSFELVRQHKCSDFTDNEWAMIGKIAIHRLCWDSIKNKCGKPFMSILQKLADDGFGEYVDKYKETIKDLI